MMATQLYGDALYLFSSHYQKLVVNEFLARKNKTEEECLPKMDYFYKYFLISKKTKRPMLNESYNFETVIFSNNYVIFATDVREVGCLPVNLVFEMGFLPFYTDEVLIDNTTTERDAVAACRSILDAQCLTIAPDTSPHIFTFVLMSVSESLEDLKCCVQVFDHFNVDVLRLNALKLLPPARIGGIFALMEASVDQIDLSEFGDLALNELFYHIHEYTSNPAVDVVKIKLESDTGVWTIRNLLMNLSWMFPNLCELRIAVSDGRLMNEMRSFNFANFFLNRYVSPDLAFRFNIIFDLNFTYEYSVVSPRDRRPFPDEDVYIYDTLPSITSKLNSIRSVEVEENKDHSKKYKIIDVNSENMVTVSHVKLIVPPHLELRKDDVKLHISKTPFGI